MVDVLNTDPVIVHAGGQLIEFYVGSMNQLARNGWEDCVYPFNSSTEIILCLYEAIISCHQLGGIPG